MSARMMAARATGRLAASAVLSSSSRRSRGRRVTPKRPSRRCRRGPRIRRRLGADSAPARRHRSVGGGRRGCSRVHHHVVVACRHPRSFRKRNIGTRSTLRDGRRSPPRGMSVKIRQSRFGAPALTAARKPSAHGTALTRGAVRVRSRGLICENAVQHPGICLGRKRPIAGVGLPHAICRDEQGAPCFGRAPSHSRGNCDGRWYSRLGLQEVAPFLNREGVGQCRCNHLVDPRALREAVAPIEGVRDDVVQVLLPVLHEREFRGNELLILAGSWAARSPALIGLASMDGR